MSADDTSYLDTEVLGGQNLYAYCLNNTVRYSDPTGCSVTLTFLLIGLVIGAIIGGTVGGMIAYDLAVETGSSGWDLFGWTLLGIFGGAILGGAVGAFVGATIGFAVESMISLITILGSKMGWFGTFALASGGVCGTSALVAIPASTAIQIGTIAGVYGAGIVFMSKPNSGRIRFSDDTGIDPERGGLVRNKDRANEIYRSLKDPVQKAKWKKYMKGNHLRRSHLDGLIFLCWENGSAGF